MGGAKTKTRAKCILWEVTKTDESFILDLKSKPSVAGSSFRGSSSLKLVVVLYPASWKKKTRFIFQALCVVTSVDSSANNDKDFASFVKKNK